MDCYICSEEGVFSFTYESTLGKKCREVRCVACAKALRNSENIIIEDKYIGEGERPLTQSKSQTTVSKKQLLDARAENQPDPWTAEES
jgi:hypothetical protein